MFQCIQMHINCYTSDLKFIEQSKTAFRNTYSSVQRFVGKCIFINDILNLRCIKIIINGDLITTVHVLVCGAHLPIVDCTSLSRMQLR